MPRATNTARGMPCRYPSLPVPGYSKGFAQLLDVERVRRTLNESDVVRNESASFDSFSVRTWPTRSASRRRTLKLSGVTLPAERG